MTMGIPKVKTWQVTAYDADGKINQRVQVQAPNKILARLNARHEYPRLSGHKYTVGLIRRTFKYESFSQTIDFAESLGFIDHSDDYTADVADALECDALEHIKRCGYKVINDPTITI
jgi:hypothetical protein